jgi:trypsin
LPLKVKWNGCGASLIAPDIILSAAHCNGTSKGETNVVFALTVQTAADLITNYDTLVILTPGVCVEGYNLTSCGQGGGVQRYIVTRVVHPLFNPTTIQYDVLVMKLNSAAPQTPIPLNSNPNYPVVNQELTVVGLGLNASKGTQYNELQQVNVPYNAPSVCDSVYGATKVNNTIQFCAGGLPQGGKDACQGDSGGPIFDSNRLLVGVVSSGDGCGLPSIPGLYVRVSGVVDWINQQVCALSATPPASCKVKPPAPTQADQPSPPPVRPTIAPVQPVSRPVSRPTSPHGPATVIVRIDVNYDSRPDETAWSLRNRSGTVFYRSTFGSGRANTVITTYVRLIPGKYQFYIRDTGGNGICCQNGNGNWAVFVTANNRIRRVARSNGKFKFVQQRDFTVPSAARRILVRGGDDEEEDALPLDEVLHE